MAAKMDVGAGQIIVTPHAHDVLCGRGGLTNQHSGNEWFRRLVRSNRALYRSCPKHTKLLVAKAIVQAVQQQEPSGRFLEVADKDVASWRQITYKRAVDKTSQALREKEQPQDNNNNNNNSQEIIHSEAVQAAVAAASKKGKKTNDLTELTKAALRQAGLDGPGGGVQEATQIIKLPPNMEQTQKKKRKASAPTPPPGEFVKPSWWNRGAPNISGSDAGVMNMNMNMNVNVNTNTNTNTNPNKRAKAEDDPVPLPPESLQARQSSLFRFLSNSGVFGRNNATPTGVPQQQPSGFFSFSAGTAQPLDLQNAGDMISAEAAAFGGQRSSINNSNSNSSNNSRLSFAMQPQQSLGLGNFDPLLLGNANSGGHRGSNPSNNNMNNINHMDFQQQLQQQQLQQQQQQHLQQQQLHQQQQQLHQQQQLRPHGAMFQANHDMNSGNAVRTDYMPTAGLFPTDINNVQAFQLQQHMATMAQGRGETDGVPAPANRLTSQVSDWLTSFFPLSKQGLPVEDTQPSPPAQNLERSISSTLFNLARTPSAFLTTLKSGVSSMFGGDVTAPEPVVFPPTMPQVNNNLSIGSAASMRSAGSAMGSESKRGSLLDDYEDSALETRLRSVNSR